MSKTWYVAKKACGRVPFTVKPVEVERSTDASVWIAGKRIWRRGWRGHYFPTRDEALNYCFNVLSNDVSKARRSLWTAMNAFAAFKDEIASEEAKCD